MLKGVKIYVRRLKAVVCLLLGLHSHSFAQLHIPDLPRNRWLALAAEQYQQGHYAMSIQSATRYLAEDHRNIYIKNSDLESARYYRCLSGLQIDIPAYTDTATTLLATTADAAYQQRIAYNLAHYYFKHNELARAISYYEIAGIANLSNRELIEEKFELAYCYFNNRQFDKAEPLFASIKELQQGKFFAAGNYYYGLLAYNENNYPDALQSFERIKDNPQYYNIVPYYIAEIYYFMGNRQKALDEAQRLISLPEKLYYDNELHLLAAQCLFEAQRYGDALPYFESYYEHAEKIRKEDLYEMAYCYYRVNEWQNAIDKFKLLSSTRDSLGQTAMYLLGDSYLKTGDKQSARNAFGICADMPFNPGQQEASMLLNAKLSYEMGYNDEALHQLNNLSDTYPQSAYRDEARTLISSLLIKTSNYAQALEQLNDVTVKTGSYWSVYQKVAFGYAMQQYQSRHLNTADSFLTLSAQHPENNDYTAAALFWKSELAYHKTEYQKAISYAQDFINNKADAGAVQYISEPATLQHAYLTIGYASMELNNYSVAQTYFKKAQTGATADAPDNMIATTREADAVFMQKDYAHSITLYDKIINGNGSEADYARYQKSIILGLQGKTADKISLLENIINQKPPSLYAANSRYELAQTYSEGDKYQSAINTLQPLTSSADGKNYAPKAWLKIGYAYQQMDNDNKAIDAYKHVITDYPNADERPAALEALKNLYLENNNPAAYTQLLKDNNLPSADSGMIDSTYYKAAETQFAAGRYDKARQGMTQYLQQYGNGAFVTKAHYYRAESNYRLKDYSDALTDYDAVLKNSWSEFSENSALRAASISYDNKDYAASLNYYQKLRNTAMDKSILAQAYNGLMKSSFGIKHYSQSQQYADTLLTLPGLDEAAINEAQFYKAKTEQQENNNDEALAIYQKLSNSKTGIIAAESRYHIAEIYLSQNKLKEAEAAANETVKQSGGYDYWIVRSYILLAGILSKEKDYFNAKATLQSIIKNTRIPELKQEAQRKLEEVKSLERQHSKLSEE